MLPLLLDGAVFFRLGNLQYEDVRDGSMPGERFVRALRHLTGTSPVPVADTSRAPVADAGIPAEVLPARHSRKRALWYVGGGIPVLSAVAVVLLNMPFWSLTTGSGTRPPPLPPPPRAPRRAPARSRTSRSAVRPVRSP